jgi:hypothetical protein
LPTSSLVALAGIICLTPLTLYLFWLATVNRADKPTAVNGVWDFVALLASLVGVMVCVGMVLSALSANVNLFARGGFRNLQNAWLASTLATAVAPISYLVLLALAAASTLRGRKQSLHVYNVDLPALEQAIADVLNQSGYDARRFGNRWTAAEPLVQLTPFQVFSHGTVKFLSADPHRNDELERQLRVRIPQLPVGDNPGGPWFTTLALTGFMATLLCIGMSFVTTYLNR